MGLITGVAPDLFAWHKWKLNWIDDSQVRCISDPGGSRHMITPLETPGGVKMVVVRLNSTTALAIELRNAVELDHAACSEGLLFYTVHTDIPTGKGPIRVLDPKHRMGRGCEPNRGGPLTSAAVNILDAFSGWTIELSQYCIKVWIEAKLEDNYFIYIQNDGETRTCTQPGGEGSS
jgi:hypothetical protein